MTLLEVYNMTYCKFKRFIITWLEVHKRYNRISFNSFFYTKLYRRCKMTLLKANYFIKGSLHDFNYKRPHCIILFEIHYMNLLAVHYMTLLKVHNMILLDP